MEFTFEIRKTLRETWELFKKHAGFFIGIAAITVVLNLAGGERTPFLFSIVLMVLAFIWSIVILKFSLAAADGKEDVLSFGNIKTIFPGWKEILGYLGVGLLGGLIVLSGLILLIIPGIWVGFRLSLASLSYIDKREGVRKALRASFRMTKGSIFWTTVLVGIVVGFLYLVGLLLLGVGILVTYPIAMIFMAKYYRALTVYHGQSPDAAQTIVVQAQEIEAPTDSAPEISKE